MDKIIKVPRTKTRYNKDHYNLQVYKTKPHSVWHIEDAARNMEQAKSMVTSQPPGCAIIVKTPEYKEFPYHIYMNESLQRKRWEEIKNGTRFK